MRLVLLSTFSGAFTVILITQIDKVESEPISGLKYILKCKVDIAI